MKKRDLVPPILDGFLSRLSVFGSNHWSGDYSSWDEALSRSEGYDATRILEKVKTATLQVKEGKAVFERDSVLFHEEEYSWPLLASLLWVAAQEKGVLNVLDFGGSLGSTYFQNRKLLKDLTTFRWSVVEQEHFVTCGNEFIKDDRLAFYLTIEDCMKSENPSIILFSSVLQYLRNPYEILNTVLIHQPKFVVVDSMGFLTEEKDRITIQKVSPRIYEASYPCWFLNKAKFLNSFSADYSLVTEFKSGVNIRFDGKVVPYEGFLFRRKTQ